MSVSIVDVLKLDVLILQRIHHFFHFLFQFLHSYIFSNFQMSQNTVVVFLRENAFFMVETIYVHITFFFCTNQCRPQRLPLSPCYEIKRHGLTYPDRNKNQSVGTYFEILFGFVNSSFLTRNTKCSEDRNLLCSVVLFFLSYPKDIELKEMEVLQSPLERVRRRNRIL